MSENNQNHEQISEGEDPKPRESTEAFCKRLGIKLHRGEKGGVEFAPFHGGNLLHKRPKKTPLVHRAATPQDESHDEQDEFDALPEEFKEHLWKAFIHKAGFGPHPGKYRGPAVDAENVPL